MLKLGDWAYCTATCTPGIIVQLPRKTSINKIYILRSPWGEEVLTYEDGLVDYIPTSEDIIKLCTTELLSEYEV